MTEPRQTMERRAFEARRLFVKHPPALHDPNKKVVLEIACPPGSVPGGELVYTRWAARILPDAFAAGEAPGRVVRHDGFYDYAPVLTVAGAERRCHVATDVNPAEGRPRGLYGNEFGRATEEAVRRATKRIDPPTVTNLVAIAAPTPRSGRYTAAQVELVLTTAFTGFRAAVLESGAGPVAIHTGFWGCGAFGGNRVLMAMLQAIAAGAAGVERLVFHAPGESGAAALDSALRAIREDLAGPPVPSAELVRQITAMGFEWGESDGN